MNKLLYLHDIMLKHKTANYDYIIDFESIDQLNFSWINKTNI